MNENKFMVEWDYTYTWEGDMSDHFETRTTGRQFQTLDEAKKFIKDKFVNYSNIKIFKLSKLEIEVNIKDIDERGEWRTANGDK